MDIADRLGTADVEQIVVAAHLTVPGVEARAAEGALVELQVLDHGAHGTVEHENALGGGGLQRGGDIATLIGHHAASAFAFTGCGGRTPSRWQIA